MRCLSPNRAHLALEPGHPKSHVAARADWRSPTGGHLVFGSTAEYPHAHLGARLRAARCFEGVPAEEAARLCEVPLWQYLSFETGKRKIPATGLVALQSELGVDREWIITGASLTDRLLMLSDEDLVRVCDFTPESYPGRAAPSAVQLRLYIANQKKIDRRWAAGVELFLQEPTPVSMRDRIDAVAEFGFRAGAFMFVVQFGVLLVLMLLMTGLGFDLRLVQALLGASLAGSMFVVGFSLSTHVICVEAEKRAEPPVETLPLPGNLKPSAFSEPTR